MVFSLLCFFPRNTNNECKIQRLLLSQCPHGIVNHTVWVNESGQNCLVESDIRVVHVVNNESHESKADSPDDPCYDWNSQHATVHMSLLSTWEGKRHQGLDNIEQCTVYILMMETAQCIYVQHLHRSAATLKSFGFPDHTQAMLTDWWHLKIFLVHSFLAAPQLC